MKGYRGAVYVYIGCVVVVMLMTDADDHDHDHDILLKKQIRLLQGHMYVRAYAYSVCTNYVHL